MPYTVMYFEVFRFMVTIAQLSPQNAWLRRMFVLDSNGAC